MGGPKEDVIMKVLFNTLFLLCVGGVLTAQSEANTCDDKRAYLGIYTQGVSEEKAALLSLPNSEGSLITEILIGGAADKAGLQPFDYVYGIDDERTDDDDDLTDLLGRYEAGEQATIHLIRRGKDMAVDVVFGRRSDSSRWKRSDAERAFLGISHEDSDKDEPGVTVDVIRSTTASSLGLKDGDVILAINDFPIIDWSDITTAINMMAAGDAISIDYERAGRIQKARGIIQSHERTAREQEREQVVEYAFLGVYSNSISKEKAHKLGFDNPYGSYVSSVIPNTAAERAGIEPFDYIYGVDEYRTGEGQPLTYILHKYQAGERAVIHYVRRNRERQVEVRFSSRDEARPQQSDKCEEAFLGVQSSHAYVERSGVSIDVIPGSTAESVGMENGDVVIRINGYPIIDWTDIASAIDNMTVGKAIEVDWVRHGREMRGSSPILSYCETKTRQAFARSNIAIQRSDQSARSAGAIDLRDVEVRVSDILGDEAREMERRYKVKLTLGNDINLKAIQIIPQPDKGSFVLTFVLPGKGQTAVRIYNDVGRNIYIYEAASFSGTFSDEVDLSQNGLGTYYLLVEQNGRTAGKRIQVRKG
jgi:S1-C subfamily serine protease